MLEDQLCYTCRWGWRFAEHEDRAPESLCGECHRYAPKPMQEDDAYLYKAVWPIVNGKDGCGDWTSRFT
jgi:ribosomal protein S27AE